MNVFDGDATDLSYVQLRSRMDLLSAEWRAIPSDAHDWPDGLRYNELRDQLRTAHGEDCFIAGTRDNPSDC